MCLSVDLLVLYHFLYIGNLPFHNQAGGSFRASPLPHVDQLFLYLSSLPCLSCPIPSHPFPSPFFPIFICFSLFYFCPFIPLFFHYQRAPRGPLRRRALGTCLLCLYGDLLLVGRQEFQSESVLVRNTNNGVTHSVATSSLYFFSWIFLFR